MPVNHGGKETLGVFLNGFPNHFYPVTLRIYGVLQRIAICYLIAAVIAFWTSRGTQVAIIAAGLIGYWILMRYVPVPEFGIPTHNMPLLDPERNLAGWLDRKLLMGYLYEGTRDPEGVISTIPAIATILLGVLTGEWLRSCYTQSVKAAGMLVFGVIGLTAGEFFNIWFPINKKLWTSSCSLLLALLWFASLCVTGSWTSSNGMAAGQLRCSSLG